jgi:hypothetical protein
MVVRLLNNSRNSSFVGYFPVFIIVSSIIVIGSTFAPIVFTESGVGVDENY